MQKITSKNSFRRQRLTAVFVGTSSRWVWWLSLALFIGGIFWAHWIYDSSLSFFLRRPDVGATVKALVIASVATGLFLIVTIRRANELGTSARARWTLLLPPLSLFWFPVLGLMKPVTEEAPDSLKRLAKALAAVLTAVAVVIVLFLAVAWWMQLEPNSAVTSEKDQQLIQPYDCIREGNKAMARVETWPLTASGEDVFLYVIRRCAENQRAF